MADIVIYNELSMFMKLQNYTWEGRDMAEFPNLGKWATKIQGLAPVSTLETNMATELKKQKFIQ